MSYVVKYLSDISELKAELSLHPENIVYYSKYSSFVGSTESIQYIHNLIKQTYDKPV
jgi:hypothetical protein